MQISRLFLIFSMVLSVPGVQAQRSYAPHSVLAAGNWYKITVSRPGIHKIDIPFLNNMGINTAGLTTASIRIFGNGGKMISESNAGPWTDDLSEHAIMVMDGGDGMINGNDIIFFYASGPDEWIKDSANARFTYRKNIYTDHQYFFVNIATSGKRISQAPVPGPPGLTVNSFSARFAHELDTVNFLASGKEWYGEEFSDAPGKTLTRTFSVNLPETINGSPFQLNNHIAARSVGNASRFEIRVNNQPLGQAIINAVGGGQYDLFAQQTTAITNGFADQSTFTVQYNFAPGSFNAQGWLNRFELFTRQRISLGAGQLLFRDWQSIGNQNAEFVIEQAGTNTQVWDITDPVNPMRMQGVLSGTTFRFVNNCSRLREYAAFNPEGALVPTFAGRIANQDLHNSSPADLLIVSFQAFMLQAERLAQLHRQKDNMRVVVVSTEQVFNEFGGGHPDPAAIRDFAKMYHDKYGTVASDKLDYLLLFGDASYDYKDRLTVNSNYVPAWENDLSLDPLSTYASDDFFGFLDDHENIGSGLVTNLLDIGIGRIPAKNMDEAKQFTDKAEAYYSARGFGPWRQNLSFIADDEDNNLHLQDAEIITATAAIAAPVMNQQKIYLDAYHQESGPGGSQYPQVNQAISNQVFNGTLMLNYNGHGGSRRLAEETVIDQEMVNNWNNPDRLPLMITATCDFAPYDNPGILSLGENILLRPKTGAIALMTTTRVVFAFSNRVMNDNYMRFALQPGPDGKFRTLGQAMMEAKNFTYQTSGDVTNNRKFTLLGDPAMRLAFPEYRVRATRVNNIPAAQADTLRSADKVTITGEVTDLAGNVLTGFNGNIYPSVFDKPRTFNTLGNDPGSQPVPIQTQTSALFKGKATVINGQFSFTFKVPKDINYQYGFGKLGLYAEDGSRDAGGFFTNFVVGGVGNHVSTDNEGPEIRIGLNDDQFVNGGTTNQDPVLIVKLSDSSGINTAGLGIGHELIATLDNDNHKYFILNDFYQGDLDDYQKGEVRFQLPELEPGPHTITIKAWDVLNNSNEAVLEFVVAKDEDLVLSHVLNYPNPFTTYTQFWFEHNKPGQDLQVTVQIFSLTGRIIKQIKKTINTPGNRSSELEWDGRDDFGDKVGRGVYFYKISVSSAASKEEKIEKMVIF